MDRINVESSRIPKSSSSSKRTTSNLIQFRRDQNLKLAGTVTNEIESAKLMPTIKEETDKEVNEFNEGVKRKASKDESSFTKYRVSSNSNLSKKEGEKLDRSNDSESSEIVTDKLDGKVRKLTNIPSINRSHTSKLFNPTQVSLARSRTKDHADKSPSNIDRQATKSINLARTQLSNSSSNKQILTIRQAVVKKMGTKKSMSRDSLKEDEKDVLKIREECSENLKERNITDTRTYTVKSKKEKSNEDQLEDKFSDHKDKFIDQSDDTKLLEQIKEASKLMLEQHVCRICLDSIQVDGRDSFVANCSESLANSNLKDQSTGEKSALLNYIAPCDCKGQSKYVHRKCLSEWIYVSKKTNCQVCLGKFRNIKISVYKKSVIRWLIDEYDHLLMLILYLIPFLIDCILVFNFLTYEMKFSNTSPKTTHLNSNDQVITEDQIDRQLDRLEKQTKYDSVDQQVNDMIYSDDKTKVTQADPTHVLEEKKSNDGNFFSSLITFKQSRSPTRTMSLNMFIYNLYFLEIKLLLKHFSFCLSGIPVTLLISFPSLILFIRYCRSRYIEWQTENLEVFIEH